MHRQPHPFTVVNASWRRAALGLTALLSGCGGVDDSAEAPAAARLKELGVLVVMDAGREHVASVNFAAVQDEQKRAEAFLQLGRLPYLTALDVSRTNPTREHLETLASATRLQSLTASNVPLTDEDLLLLAGLSRIESLQLPGTGVTAAGVETLGRFRSVKILNLSATKVNGGLEPLARLPELNWLVLNQVTIEDDSLASLAPRPKLGAVKPNGQHLPG